MPTQNLFPFLLLTESLHFLSASGCNPIPHASDWFRNPGLSQSAQGTPLAIKIDPCDSVKATETAGEWNEGFWERRIFALRNKQAARNDVLSPPGLDWVGFAIIYKLNHRNSYTLVTHDSNRETRRFLTSALYDPWHTIITGFEECP